MQTLLLSALGTAVSVAVGVLAAGAVVFAVVWHFVQKKRGKTGGCGCGCEHCGLCSSCRGPQKKEEPAAGKDALPGGK